MNLEDLLAALDVGSAHRDLAVKTAGSEDGRIQDIDAVGSRHDDDPFIDAEAVHFDQQLVQGLLALIMGAAQSGAPAPCDGIDLIDKNDAG